MAGYAVWRRRQLGKGLASVSVALGLVGLGCSDSTSDTAQPQVGESGSPSASESQQVEPTASDADFRLGIVIIDDTLSVNEWAFGRDTTLTTDDPAQPRVEVEQDVFVSRVTATWMGGPCDLSPVVAVSRPDQLTIEISRGPEVLPEGVVCSAEGVRWSLMLAVGAQLSADEVQVSVVP